MSSFLQLTFNHNLHFLEKDLAETPIEIKISFFGGRKFSTLASIRSISMRELMKRVALLYKKSYKSQDIFLDTRNILKKLSELDLEASTKLKEKNFFIQIATSIKSWLSSFAYDWRKEFKQLEVEIDAKLEPYDAEEAKRVKENQEALEREKRISEMSLIQILEKVKLPEILLDTSEVYGKATLDKVLKSTLKIADPENVVLLEHLNKKVESFFLHKKGFGYPTELLPIFEQLKDKPNSFIKLAMIFASIRSLHFTPAHFCRWFEALSWPTESLKERLMPQLLALSLQNSEAIRVKKSETDDHTSVFSSTLYLDKIIGADLYTREIPQDLLEEGQMPVYLAKGIELFLRKWGNQSHWDLVFNEKQREERMYGFQLEILGKTEEPFDPLPSKIIAPLLPLLQNILTLVSFSCQPSLYRRYEKNSVGIVFTDEDIDSLIALIQNNSCLNQVKLDISGMTQAGQERFNQLKEKIFLDPKRQLSIKERILLERAVLKDMGII